MPTSEKSIEEMNHMIPERLLEDLLAELPTRAAESDEGTVSILNGHLEAKDMGNGQTKVRGIAQSVLPARPERRSEDHRGGVRHGRPDLRRSAQANRGD